MTKWKASFIERGDNSTFEIRCNGNPVLYLWNCQLDEDQLFKAADDLVDLLNKSFAHTQDPSKPASK